MKLVFALLALILVRNILLYKTIKSIPLLEIKRRARQADNKSKQLYKVAVYEDLFDLREWLIGTSLSSVLLIWAARTNWWLAVIILVIIAWLVVWTKFSAEGWAGNLAALAAPFDAKLLSILKPILSPISRWLPKGRLNIHSGLYEKKDLLELLNKQNIQTDNRISDIDLKIATGAMTFGDKKVGQLMTPRRQVKLVKDDELAGPILTDELHKTGFSRFPVVKDSAKSASPQIIGTLYLSDLIGYEGSGKVKDLADKKVYFINEDATLRQALQAFLKTHHHLLIVVNSFEEMVGVLSLEDVLEQIIGAQIIDEFDAYANLRAVAAMKAEAEQASQEEVKPEQTTESVVE